MATLKLRTEQALALTNLEVDNNFSNLNNELITAGSYNATTGSVTLTTRGTTVADVTFDVKPNTFLKVQGQQSNGTVRGTVTADAFDDTLILRENGGITLAVDSDSGKDIIKFAHADTSSVANHSNDNSGGTVIQDLSLTFDTYGHVTAISSTDANLDNRYLQLTGGTMTGNITFSDDVEGIVWSRNTDGAFIKFHNTADSDTDSYLEFNTADNGNEYFKFTTTSGASTYTLADLKLNGSVGDLSVFGIKTRAIQSSGNDTLVISGWSAAATAGAAGKAVQIQGGNGSAESTTGGNGGSINLFAGYGGQYKGTGGNVNISSGQGGGSGAYPSKLTLSGAADTGVGPDATLEAGTALGSNKAGGDVYIKAGKGTGTGDPGRIIFQTSPLATSGSTTQTLGNRVIIDETGITTGVWKATVIADEYGGTGQSSYAKGDILYASGANVLSKLSAGTNGHYLKLVNGVPSWAVAVTEDANTTYSVSVPSSTTKIRLSGSDSTTDDIEIAGGTNVTVTRNSDSKLTIASTDTTYSTATSTALGLIKIGYAESGKNYPVELDTNGKAYVNVPWVDTDTNTTYSKATSTTLGLVKIGYTENAKNYPVELDTNGKAYVNVPWVDTDTNTWRPIDTTPTSGATTESISSSWAYNFINGSAKANFIKLSGNGATTGQEQAMHIEDGAAINIFSGTGYGFDNYIYGDADTTSGKLNFQLGASGINITKPAGTVGIYLGANGDITMLGTLVESSDRKLKSEIEPIADALDKVNQLGGYTYIKEGFEDKRTGVIAQEVQEVLPEAVSEGEDGTLHVAYGNMVGLLIEAIKELKAEVEELKAINK